MIHRSISLRRNLISRILGCIPIAITVLLAACGSTTTLNAENGTTFNGLTLIDRVNSATIPFFQSAKVTATCKPGETIISGGFSITPTPVIFKTEFNNDIRKPYVSILASYPSASNEWTVFVSNQSLGDNKGSVLVLVHAVCSPSAVLTQTISDTQQISGEQGIPLGAPGPWTVASCPSHSVLLGGGFKVEPYQAGTSVNPIVSDPYLADSNSGIPTGWKVATTVSSTVATITSFAICTIPAFLLSPNVKQLNLYSTVTGYHGIGASPILNHYQEYFFTANGSDACSDNTLLASEGFVVPDNQKTQDNQIAPNHYQLITRVESSIPNYLYGNHGEWETRGVIYHPGWLIYNTGGWEPQDNNYYTGDSLLVRSVCVQVLNGSSSSTPIVPTISIPPTSVKPISTPTGGAPPPPPTETPVTIQPTPTETPVTVQPTSTSTPVPTGSNCTPISNGTSSLNVDLSYLNLLNGAIATTSGGSHLQFTYGPTGGLVIAPINGAATALSTEPSYAAITCSQLSTSTYGLNTVAAGNQVFLVKISNTEYTKIQMRYAVGSASVSLIWQTYSIS